MHFDIDEIYHLACPASPCYYRREPILTLRACYEGTWNVLELAKESRARVLFASTSEVYGDPQQHPQKESYWGYVNPVGERACYDEGKRCAEALLVSYSKQFKVQTRIARIFNTYGPRMHPNDGRVVSTFATNALRGSSIEVYGDGHQTRSFCFVADLVDGLLALMQSQVDTPVNLGRPEEISVVSLAELVIQMAGSSSKIVHVAPVQDDPGRRCPDVTQARVRLGWEASTPLDQGLALTIEHYRSMVALARRDAV